MSCARHLGRRRVMVVEDEYFLAEDLARDIAREGAEVIGPAASVDDALDLIEAGPVDGAILDINLRGDMAFPVADALRSRNVPFVFATGYDSAAIPARYALVGHWGKPVDVRQLLHALFG